MVKKRDEISDAYKWDLTTIFETDSLFEAELTSVLSAIDDVPKLSGTLINSADTLLTITE